MRFEVDGRPTFEELFGREGFSGPSSLLYHRHMPESAHDISEGPADMMAPEREQVHEHAHLQGFNLQPEGDIVSAYTTLPWTTLCEEVAKLRIRLREGRLIVLPKVANSDGAAENLLQPLLQTRRVSPERPVLSALSTSSVSVPDGIRRLGVGCKKPNRDATLPRTRLKCLRIPFRRVPLCSAAYP